MSRFPSMRDYATVTVVAVRDTGYCNSSEIDVGKSVKQRFSFWRFSSWVLPAFNNAVSGVAPAIEPSISRFPSLGSHSFLLRLGDRRQYTPPTQPTANLIMPAFTFETAPVVVAKPPPAGHDKPTIAKSQHRAPAGLTPDAAKLYIAKAVHLKINASNI